MSPARLGPENDCADEDQQLLQTTESITASVQLENKITDRESQGACRQGELIGGKPQVVN
jgi:hypothetical protein